MESFSGRHEDAHPSTACRGRPACLHSRTDERFHVLSDVSPVIPELICGSGWNELVLYSEHWRGTNKTDRHVLKLAVLPPFSAGYHLTRSSLQGHQKVQMYHHYIEAAKFANGLKRSISDPGFSDGKVGNIPLLLWHEILQWNQRYVLVFPLMSSDCSASTMVDKLSWWTALFIAEVTTNCCYLLLLRAC